MKKGKNDAKMLEKERKDEFQSVNSLQSTRLLVLIYNMQFPFSITLTQFNLFVFLLFHLFSFHSHLIHVFFFPVLSTLVATQ
jgi:hypothetical protein